MKESDETYYYSEIVEYLQHESSGNAERLVEWAASKSADAAKWLRLMKRRARGYFLVGAELCHGRHGTRRQVVVGPWERRALLRMAHIHQETGVHVGVSKMYAELCTSYFWEGLYRDVKDFVRNCGNCVEIPVSGVAVGGAGQGSAPEVTAKDASCDAGCHPSDDVRRIIGGGGSKQLAALEVWAEVEVTVLPAPLGRRNSPSMLVLVDPASHWMSAQAFSVDTSAMDVSEAAAAFAFSTFCTLGFPRICTVISESGIKRDSMLEKMKTLMEPLRLDWILKEGKKKAATLLRKREHNNFQSGAPPPLASGTSHDPQSPTLSSTPALFSLVSSPYASSSCKWAWESAKGYMLRESWPLGLDAFLFEERRKMRTTLSSSSKCAFSLMFGRSPVRTGNSSRGRKEEVDYSGRWTVRSSDERVVKQWRRRGGVSSKEEPSGEASDGDSLLPPDSVSTSSEGPSPLRTRDAKEGSCPSGTEEVTSKAGKKVHHRSKSTSCSWRTMRFLAAHGGMRKQCQRGVSRLLALVQAGTAASPRSDAIPRDGRRSNFTAETVASVRAALEAKRSGTRTRRGSYQRYSAELRERIAEHALSHGVGRTAKHFSGALMGGKPISESTVRNFLRSFCSSERHSSAPGEETAPSKHHGTVSRRLRCRAPPLGKPGSSAADCSGEGRNASGEGRRVCRRRYGALLRGEIGAYATRHGVRAAMKHFSERLSFPVREHTIRKFLNMFEEKGGKENLVELVESGSLDARQISSPLGKSPVGPSIGDSQALHQQAYVPAIGNSSGVLVEGPASLVVYGEYSGPASQQQMVAYHDGCLPGYESSSAGQTIILDQGDATAAGFFGSQDLDYQHHSVSAYSPENVRHPDAPPTAAETLAMDHFPSAASATMSQEGPHVSLPHVTSQPYGSVMPHQLMGDYQSESRDVLNNHLQTVSSRYGETSQEHLSPPSDFKGPDHPSVRSLPTSSFFHDSKSRLLISPSELSPGGAREGNLVNSDVTSLRKSMGNDLLPSYYPLTVASPDTFQLEGSDTCAAIQIGKNNSVEISGVSQTQILEVSMLPTSPLGHQDSVSNEKEMSTISGDKPECDDGALQREEAEAGHAEGVGTGSADFSFGVQLHLTGNELESLVEAADVSDDAKQKSPKKSKKKMKGTQKSKRGNYIFLSPELRARIGRYAAEHGNLKAAKHFEAEAGRQIPESTIRGFRDKYVVKQMHIESSTQSSEGSSQMVTALGYAPRGRPMVLGKYDEVVQDCMHELVKAGERVSSALAITTARQVLSQYEPSLLEEFGGPIRLNNSWAKSFIKRVGLSSNS